jgi:hypothetical protein
MLGDVCHQQGRGCGDPTPSSISKAGELSVAIELRRLASLPFVVLQ